MKPLEKARKCTLGTRAKLPGNEHGDWVVLPELMDKERVKRDEIIKLN